MDRAGVHELVEGLLGVLDDDAPDAEVLMVAGRQRSLLRGWLDGVDVALARWWESVGGFCEQSLADSARIPLSEAARIFERAAVVAKAPAFGVGLAAGVISAAHVDEWDRALRRLEPDQRPGLLADQERLAQRAQGL